MTIAYADGPDVDFGAADKLEHTPSHDAQPTLPPVIQLAAVADTVFTVDEAAAYLKIGKTKLYELLKSGRLRGKKLDRKTLFTLAALDQCIENLPDYP